MILHLILRNVLFLHNIYFLKLFTTKMGLTGIFLWQKKKNIDLQTLLRREKNYILKLI